MPPKPKKVGRPIKKYPEVSGATNSTDSGDQSENLATLVNAAQSLEFNFQNAWPQLDQVSERLRHVKSLQTSRGLSKENHKQLAEAVNTFHVILVAPLSILENTPGIYKDEFKNRAVKLAGEYLQFCLDVMPKKDGNDKDQFLEMIREKLLKPIQEQLSLWGPHSLQITDVVAQFEDIWTTAFTRRSNFVHPNVPPTGPPGGAPNTRLPVPPYASGGGFSQYDPFRANYDQPPHYPYYSQSPNVYQTGPNPFPGQGQQPYVPAQRDPLPAGHIVPGLLVNSHHSNQLVPQPHTDPPVERRTLRGPGVKPYKEPKEPKFPISQRDLLAHRRETQLETDEVMEQAPPRLQRPVPRPLTEVNNPAAESAPNKNITRVQKIEAAEEAIRRIERHPLYAPEMYEAYGEFGPPVKMGEEDLSDSSQADDDVYPVYSSSPKRHMQPDSSDDVDDSRGKRKRTENGFQTISNYPPRRPLSPEEARRRAVATEHKEDIQFLNETPVIQRDENDIAPTPVLVTDPPPSPRRGMRRSLSRSSVTVTENLTPEVRDLMSPIPRESSPPREGWRIDTPSLYPVPEPPIPTAKKIPSHIRQKNYAEKALVTFRSPGVNALGAKSPEAIPTVAQLAPDLPLPTLQHAPPVDAFEGKEKDLSQILPILPMPTHSSLMPNLMHIHDDLNSSRPVGSRFFYLFKRSVAAAQCNEWHKTRHDGTITLTRYFLLSQEEIDETKEYLRFLTGRVATRPKTMVRLVCRPRNGEDLGDSVHAWPENTMLALNGKYLATSMYTPLYIAAEDLRTMNQIRVKFYPNAVQGYFSIFLEVFSVFSFSEIKSFLMINSPEPNEALLSLKELARFEKDSEFKVPLTCAGIDHPMTFPVFGKYCKHIERVDLSCYLQQVTVGPDFIYSCPLCGKRCEDDFPLVVDKLVLGVLSSDSSDFKGHFQITSDGQICGDSMDETDQEEGSEENQDDDSKIAE